VELEAVINALPGIVSVVDTHFRVLHANEAAYKQFGQGSLEEILGKTCYTVRKGLKKPCPQCSLIAVFQDGQPKIRVSTPEEEKLVGHSTKAFAVPLFDKKGKIWGGVEVIMDVTDIRKANESLERLNKELVEKNAFIQTILDQLPIGIALNTINKGEATYINKKFEEIYGWEKEEIGTVPKFFKKVYPDPVYREAIMNRIMGDIQSGDPSKMHWENVEVTTRNGTRKIVNAVNIPLPEQNTMVSTVSDITGLKKAEKALMETNDLLSKFIHNSPIYAFIKEVKPHESKVIMVSENYVEMIGVPASQMVGKNMQELFPPEFAGKITDDDWQVVSNGNTILLDEDLNGRHYTTVKFPINQGDRNLLAGYTIDITERIKSEKLVRDKNEELVKANRELLKAKQKAEESDRLKTAFLANMSHEIRTPMNSIMGFASLLPEEESRELMNQYAEIIVRSSEQLVHIIDDIVLYSRLQTRLLSYIPGTFDVAGLLLDVKQSFNLPDFQKNVQLVIDPNSEKAQIITSDYDKMRQIYTNLVSNAFKYTSQGTISIGYQNRNNRLLFFVRDTGMGIPKGEEKKIFDRFYRASNVNKGQIGGTGLGLSIVKELADLLGGQVWAENNAKDANGEKGASFYFSIRQSDAKQAEPEAK
ncbi:MAG TPA: PAS domain S-box protein, partial [Prolixibacteraceae bacterium]|nr:PAS domain S-box protein [Prolixibacteraceae bacterium]